MLVRLTNRLTRYFTQVQTTESGAVVLPKPSNAIPIHLRPYDKSKYEVPMEKIKINSGIFIWIQGMLFLKLNLSLALRS
jgi:hypothetical protein